MDLSPHSTPAAVAESVSSDADSTATDHGLRTTDPKAISEARRRQAAVQTFTDLVRSGVSKAEAARTVGEDYVSLWRWRKAYREHGLAGLLPGTQRSGRKSLWEVQLRNPDFTGKLTELYVATIGASGANVTAGRRTAKAATALVCMAEEPECPAPLAAQLRAGKIPVVLQRYLRTITPEIEARVRGSKNFGLNGFTSRRDLTVRFPDGQIGELPAGFKWVFDDMSVNQPFWCAVDGKILFSRQGLYAIDHRSLRWLGKELIARPREAYRADDILRFLRRLFAIYGKPDVIVFEQGVWKSRKIRGYKLTVEGAVVEDEAERPELPLAEREALETGLLAIGVKIVFAYSAHGKIIETCFNHFQSVLAIKAREFVNLGRHAGEFEIGAKRLRQVRSYLKSGGANGRSPSDTGFAPMEALSDLIDATFAHINGSTNSRHEVPDAIWSSGLAARPLLPLETADLHVFLPEMREAVIRAGRIVVTVDGQPHDYRADWMAVLGTGYRVFIRFDPSEPTLGACVFNRESGASSRRLDDAARGYALGEIIGYAAWECPAPSLDVPHGTRGIEPQPLAEFYGEGAVDSRDAERQKQNQVVATAFSALPRPGAPAVKVAEARDGAGGVARIERGGRATVAAPQPEQTTTTTRPRPQTLPVAPRREQTVDTFAALFGG